VLENRRRQRAHPRERSQGVSPRTHFAVTLFANILATWGVLMRGRMSALEQTRVTTRRTCVRHARGIMRQRVLFLTIPLLLACVLGAAVGVLAARVL